jgi:uncharacterized protein YceH (UPF0502 family)
MDERFEAEVQAIRSELADIRRELDRIVEPKLPRPARDLPIGREIFMDGFIRHLADQFSRRSVRMRIEQRIEALEKRVADLEARCGVGASLN